MAVTGKLIGVLVFVLMVTALAPTIFERLSNLSGDANAPAWFTGIVVTIGGIVMLLLFLKGGGIKTGA